MTHTHHQFSKCNLTRPYIWWITGLHYDTMDCKLETKVKEHSLV